MRTCDTDGDVEAMERRLIAEGSPYALQRASIAGQFSLVFLHGPPTIADIYSKAVSRGDAALVVCNGATLTYGGFFRDAARLAAALYRRYGIGPGKRVGIALGNGPSTIIAFVAVTWSGAVAVLIGERDSEHIRYCSDLAACDALIAEAVRGDIAGPVVIVGRTVPSDASPADMTPLADLIGGSEESASPTLVSDPDAEAVIAFSSGTTGRPKGALLTHRAVVTGLMNMMLAGSLAKAGHGASAMQRPKLTPHRPCTLLLSPFSHVGGYTQFLLQLMLSGKLVLGSNWSARKIATTIEKENVRSIIGLTPAVTRALLRLATDYDLGSLASLHIGGFALHRSLADAITAGLPHITVGTSYGMTETSGAICALSGPTLSQRPNSAGRILPTVDLKIVGSEGDEVVPGQLGEIWIRGAMLLKNYIGGPQDALRDGWLRTGDSGFVSKDRFLTVVDRLRDMIDVDGQMVSCLGIERAVMEGHDVDDVAVFGLEPDGSIENLAVALVAAKDDSPDLTAIRDDVAMRFPVNPLVLRCAELPRNPSGKVNYDELKKEFRERLATMGEIHGLLNKLAALRITLWVEQGELRFRAPDKAMTDDLRAEIAQRRAQLISTWPWGSPATDPSRAIPAASPQNERQPKAIPGYLEDLWARVVSGDLGVNYTNASNNVFRYRAPLDLGILKRSLGELRARHPIVTAKVNRTENGLEFAFDPGRDIAIEFVDLSSMPAEQSARAAADCAHKMLWRAFELNTERLMRVFVVKVAEHDHVVGLVIHHFVGDAVSAQIAGTELMIRYNDIVREQSTQLPQLSMGYEDYLEGMKYWVETDAARKSLAYWRDNLKNACASALPKRGCDTPTAAGHLAAHSFAIDPETAQALRRFAASRGVTIFVALLAANFLALSSMTGARDVMALTFVSCRDNARLWGIIGSLLNLLHLRVEVSERETLDTLIPKVRAAYAGALKHKLCPYELVRRILPEIGAAGELPYAPLFNFMEGVWPPNAGHAVRKTGSSAVERFDAGGAPVVPLRKVEFESHYFELISTTEGIRGLLRYSSLVHEEKMVHEYVDLFCGLLRRSVADFRWS